MRSIYFATILLFCLISSTVFSQAIYMKITDSNGPIDGSVMTRGYERYIELASAQFGLERSISQTGTGPGTVGKTSLSPFTITKHVDLSSTKLMLTFAAGPGTNAKLDGIQIDFLNNSQQGDLVLAYRIELTNVYLTKHSVSVVPNCPNGCSDLAESFEMTFQKVKVTTYTDGRADPKPFTLDITTGGTF